MTGRNGNAPFTLNQFDTVWAWGNPLLEDSRSYAVYLYDNVAYHVLAQITTDNYYSKKAVWEQSLYRYGVTRADLIDVVLAYADALKENAPDSTGYIAKKLDTERVRVIALMNFIHMPTALEILPVLRNIAENNQKEYIHSRDTSIKAPTPNELSIQMAKTSHLCAAGFDGCHGEIKGRYAVCPSCYKQLGSYNPDEWDTRTQSWLPDMMRQLRKQWRKDARNGWYRENYSHLSPMELERYLDAA